MPSCNPNDLLDAAKCFICLSPTQAQVIRIRLLCAIINGEVIACDPASLMAAANCMLCLTPGQLQAIEISLLCQLATSGTGGGGGGGSGGALRTTGNPEGVLVSPTANSLAYDCTTGGLYMFCGVAGAKTGWLTLIAP